MLRVILMILATASASSADLFAISDSHVERRYYSMSTADASTTLLSTGPTSFGTLDMTLGTDGELYAVHGIGIDRLDPDTGSYEWVQEIGGNCFAQGAVVSRDGDLLVGVLHFCSSAFWPWEFESEAFHWEDRILLLDDFIPGTAALRDDGQILVMEYSGSVDVYAVNDGGDTMVLFASFEKGTVAESFATDPVTGRTYMLGHAPGDDWSLYEIDMYTLDLTRIGPVEPADIVGIAGMPPCGGDFNVDGELNILDFVAYQLAWQAQDTQADLNGDGVFSQIDFIWFQERFLEGCP